MNSWLSKKLLNLKSQDVSKKAFTKLEELQNRNNVIEVGLRNPKETSSTSQNCSSVSGLNNTISITLRQDLLANTDLGNFTTIEDVARDPDFQEFMSAQVQLYLKFIANASKSCLLSTAGRRVVSDRAVEISGSTIPVHDQQYVGRQTDLNGDCTLSLIEEEETLSMTQMTQKKTQKSACFARNGLDAPEQTSPLKDSNKAQPPVKRPSRMSRRNAEAILLAENSHSDSGQEIAESDSPEQLKVSPTRTERKPGQKAAKNESLLKDFVNKKCGEGTSKHTSVIVNTHKAEDVVFKVPALPKSKTTRSRTNTNRSDIIEARPKKRQSASQSADDIFKAPAPSERKASSSPSENSKSSVSPYRSRTGRVSKPPGSYWDPFGDNLAVDKETRNLSRTAYNPKADQSVLTKKSKVPAKRPADSPLSGINSESGYTSAPSSERKMPSPGKKSRPEATKKNEKVSETSHNGSAVPQKLKRGRSRKVQDTEPAAHQKPKVTKRIPSAKTAEEQEEPPRTAERYAKKTAKPAVIAQPPSNMQNKATAPAQADKKHIFSDSCSSDLDDETILISNTTRYYDKTHRKEVDTARIGRVSLVESSSDEEEVVARKVWKPTRSKKVERERSSDEEEVAIRKVRKSTRSKKVDPPLFADKQSLRNGLAVDRLIEENAPVNKTRVVNRKHVRNLEIETSPLLNPTFRKTEKGKKPRYIFSGSSTDDDSMCSLPKNKKNRENQDSGSFVDDASYVSSTRSFRGRENPIEAGGDAARQFGGSRRPRLVSRFRI